MVLRNEITDEVKSNIYKKLSPGQRQEFIYADSLYLENLNDNIIHNTRDYINFINRVYIRIYNNANDSCDRLIRHLQKTNETKEAFLRLKREYHNDKLAEFVENTNEVLRIVEYKGHLYQKIDPIYLDPEHLCLKAHFYAPRKQFFGHFYSTFWVNIIVIWIMSVILFMVLYFRLLKKAMDYIESVSYRWKKQT